VTVSPANPDPRSRMTTALAAHRDPHPLDDDQEEPS
jgi:hypothetical protein